MRQFSKFMKWIVARLGNPYSAIAPISLLVEIVGFSILAAAIRSYAPTLIAQVKNTGIAAADAANIASVLGYLIWCVVLLKSIASDLYTMLWHENDPKILESLRTSEQSVFYFLCGVHAMYVDQLPDGLKASPPKVRVNIMIPRLQPHHGEMLQLAVAADRIDYTDAEWEEAWAKGAGKCGRAWESKAQQIYVADIQTEETAFAPMGDRDPEAIQLKSVLSTPVLWHDKVVAVLNADSREGGAATLLHTRGIRVRFNDAARELAPLLTNRSFLRE